MKKEREKENNDGVLLQLFRFLFSGFYYAIAFCSILKPISLFEIIGYSFHFQITFLFSAYLILNSLQPEVRHLHQVPQHLLWNLKTHHTLHCFKLSGSLLQINNKTTHSCIWILGMWLHPIPSFCISIFGVPPTGHWGVIVSNPIL